MGIFTVYTESVKDLCLNFDVSCNVSMCITANVWLNLNISKQSDLHKRVS